MEIRRRRPLRPIAFGRWLLGALLLGLALGPVPAGADVRISNLSVFLNDYDVTVVVVLFDAIPDSLHESIHTGIAAHVRDENMVTLDWLASLAVGGVKVDVADEDYEAALAVLADDGPAAS